MCRKFGLFGKGFCDILEDFKKFLNDFCEIGKYCPHRYAGSFLKI